MAVRLSQTLVVLLFLSATVLTAILGSKLNISSGKVKKYKKDFFVANQLKHGFLNGEQWSSQVEHIIAAKIDSFSFSSKNKQVLHEQVSRIMNRLVDQVDVLLHEKQEKMGANLKMKAIRMFVDLEKVREKIPDFASIVVAEVEKSGNKDKVRDLVKSKIHDLLSNHDHPVVSEQQRVLEKYKFRNLRAFNEYIQIRTERIELQQRVWGYQLIGLMGAVLLIWIVLLRLRLRPVYSIAFLFSVLISFVNLYTGINLPMLEIDARISQLDLEILGSHVNFYDQVLFYQSKSILEVAVILITKGKLSAILVGALILVFSVGFPVLKLMAATFYLFLKEKSNWFIRVMTFKSGKWSMADVMVVAIFIAYMGFQSIINEQLSHISSEAGNSKTVNLLTTNRSNLQIGFVVFLAFVLFNLFLSAILKRITQLGEPKSRFAEMWRNRRQLMLEELSGPDADVPSPPKDRKTRGKKGE